MKEYIGKHTGGDVDLGIELSKSSLQDVNIKTKVEVNNSSNDFTVKVNEQKEERNKEIELVFNVPSNKDIKVDSELSLISSNPVQNKVITEELKKKGTYSKPNTGIPKNDLANSVQESLNKADSALQSYEEQYTGTVTGIKMNGVLKGTSGIIDLGTVITEHQDISNLATKEEVTEEISKIEVPSLEDYATKTWVNDHGFLTEHQDISGLATKEEVSNAISEIKIPSIEGLATEQFVTDEIEKIEIPSIDHLATKEELANVNSSIKTVIEDLLIPENAKESLDTLEEISAWIQSHPDDAAAMNEQIIALQKLAHAHNNKAVLDGISNEKVSVWDSAEKNAKDYADSLADNYEVAGAASKALADAKTWVDKQNFLTEHQDISNLATKGEVATAEQNAKDYTNNEIAKLSDVYAEKTDLEGLATEDWVSTEIAKAQLEGEDIDLSGYATKEWVDQQGFLTEVANEFITETELTAKGYATLTEVNQGLSEKQETLVSGTNIKTINNQPLLGSGNITIDLSLFKVVSELPIKTSDIDINKIYLIQSQDGKEGNVYIEYIYVNNAWEEIGKYTATINLDPYALKTEIPSLDGYATEEWVKEQNYLTKHQDITGKQDIIEDLETIRSNASKGATALQSVPGEYITETELVNKNYATVSQLNNKVDKVNGKQLSTEDFTTLLKQKLEKLSNYDDTNINNAVTSIQNQLNTLLSGNADSAINSFNEIISFLEGIEDSKNLDSIIVSIEQQIASKQDKITDLSSIRSGAAKGETAVQPGSLSKVAISGSYNDLSNKPTIPSAVTESTVSGWGFTKNTGTYSKPSTGIPKNDLSPSVQTSLDKADTALQSIPSEYVIESELANVATSGSYNDLNNKPSLISLDGVLSIEKGGTGAVNAEDARNNLGVYSKAEIDELLFSEIELPNGYTQLEYIESTGTQYIDTDFIANQDTRVVIESKFKTVPTDYAAVFGSRNGDAQGFWLYYRPAQRMFAYRYGSTGTNYFVNADPLAQNVFDVNKNNISAGGNSATAPEDTFNCASTLFLFAVNATSSIGYTSKLTMYSCRIYDNGTLIRNFVPCINPSGKIGMYDIVNRIFYSNSGSGEFLSGPVVLKGVTPINQGGTGAINAEDARRNLGITPENIGAPTIDGMNTELAKKQNVISDLDTIRTGASKGATALQSYTETDPIFKASAAYNIGTNDITNWNNKISGDSTITKIVKVSSLPSSPDSNTLYIIV